MNLSDILHRLEGVRPNGDGYMACCPCHADSTPSLSLREKDGKILVKCFAGCSFADVSQALGMGQEQDKPVKEAEYLYADGCLKKTKYRRADGTKFYTWRHLKSGRWEKGRGHNRPGLYFRESDPKNSVLFLVEGEKDVETLFAQKQNAVSLPDGAQSHWLDEYGEFFRGRAVAVLPDNDEPGHAFAERCARAISTLGSYVTILDLKRSFPDLPTKADITDAIVRYGLDNVRTALEADFTRYEEFKPRQESGLQLQRISDVEYTPPSFLMEPYFPIGKGTLVQGDPGTGKTAFLCAIAAAVTTGQPILGIPIAEPGNVLLLSVEDDDGVLQGRITASGGDSSRVFTPKDSSNLRLDSPEIEAAIEKTNAKLLIFDPFQAFLGQSVDMNRANETRPVLAKLFAMCYRQSCACAIVAHTSKGADMNAAVYRSLGSADIPAAMRSVLHIAKDPQNPRELLVFHVKSSNAAPGETLRYTIGDRGGVTWLERCNLDIDALKRMDKAESEMDNPFLCEAELRDVLYAVLESQPQGGFISYETLNNTARAIQGYTPWNNSRHLSSLLAQNAKKLPWPIRVGVKQGRTAGIRIEIPDAPAQCKMEMQ